MEQCSSGSSVSESSVRGPAVSALAESFDKSTGPAALPGDGSVSKTAERSRLSCADIDSRFGVGECEAGSARGTGSAAAIEDSGAPTGQSRDSGDCNGDCNGDCSGDEGDCAPVTVEAAGQSAPQSTDEHLQCESLSTRLRRSRRCNAVKPVCSHCGVDCSALWTRVEQSSLEPDRNTTVSPLLLCHSCSSARADVTRSHHQQHHHHQQQQRDTPDRSASSEPVAVEPGPEGFCRKQTLRRCARSQQQQRQQHQPGQQQQANGVPAARGRGRRSVWKRTPVKCPPIVATTVTSEYLFHRGVYYQIGDIVSLLSLQRRVYFAQIRGLLQDQFCQKSAVITWLIPTVCSPPPEQGFDPSSYIIGPDEHLPRRLDCMKFVCRAPSDYFKLRNTPYPTPAPHVVAQGAKFVFTRLGPVALNANTDLTLSADSD